MPADRPPPRLVVVLAALAVLLVYPLHRRYLYPEQDGTYAIDFNLAYHPSCVYDARHSCPLTPAENRLPVRIEAGERLAIEPRLA